MAQLWYPKPLPEHKGPKHGTNPSDMFQVKAEPYEAWATQEYQVIGGQQFLASEPNLKNSAYPTTRSGFFKVTFFVKAKANTDYTAFMKHWLEIHVPNVKETMLQVDGFVMWLVIASNHVQKTMREWQSFISITNRGGTNIGV